MRSFLILILFMALVSESRSQSCNYRLSGKVILSDGTPLESASVTLGDEKSGFITNSAGAFYFSNVCTGLQKIIVRHIGFETNEKMLTISGDTTVIITLEAEIRELEAIVVHEESHQEGTNISRLSRNDLEALAGKSLGEQLRGISGVGTIQAGPGVSKPVIHGVNGQRILILNNGVRLEGQQWGAEHAPEIDPFIASDIQVIKDASSIRHGVDAIGGVVIVTPPPLPEVPGLGGYLQTIGQSNGRGLTVSGSLQGGIKNAPGWGWRIQGTGKQSGDFQAPDYSLTNTGLKELNFSVAAGYHGKTGGYEIFASQFSTEIGILSGSVSSSVGDLADAISSPVPRYTLPFSHDISNPKQAVIHRMIKMNGHQAAGSGTWRWMYAWQQNNRKEYDVRRSGLSQLPAIDLELNTHTAEVEWEESGTGASHLRFGANGMYQHNANIFGTQRIPFIPDYTSATGGLYSIWNYEAGQIKFDGGLRYDVRWYDVAGYDFKNTLYKQELMFQNVSATAGLSLRRPGGNVVMTSISSAWRPPHVSELFSLGTHQSAAAIEYGLFLDSRTNEILSRDEVDFKNEQSLKWVGGWKSEKENFSAEFSAFGNLIFNYFYLRPGGITRNIRGAYPFFRYAQTNALFFGSDVSVNWKPTNHLTISPRGNFLYAADITRQDFLPFIPANRLELFIKKEKALKNGKTLVFAEFRNRYVFRQFLAPRVINPEAFLNYQNSLPVSSDDRIFDFMAAPDGYFLSGISAGLNLKSEKIRYDIRLSADNLFNTSYREYTNRFRYFADEPGRNFILSVKTTF